MDHTEQLCERIKAICREMTASKSETRLRELAQELLTLLDDLIQALKREKEE